MANTKEYYIKINGLTESVSVVESLNKQLDALDKRIKAIESSNVKVNATSSGGGGSSSRVNELTEEEKVLKQIEATERKIEEVRSEEYQELLHQKDILKDVKKVSAGRFSEDNLAVKEYANTMQGLKERLADIKAVINTTDLGDTEKIKKMTQEANELTTKLKDMEAAYGTFGRNVGNYQDAANGFKGLSIQVGDVTKEFDNAKQALKELKKERDTLSTKKDMGLISEEEAKRLQDLIPTVAQLQSSIQDAGKPMDALMDSMQSFVAVMQTTKGLSAFFGIDNSEVEKTIKNLVALQNAMQGLQTIQKQIQTREGIGGWIAPFTVQIDKATASLLRFNTALLGTGKAANVAAKGIKMVGTAMKALVSIGIVAIISVIVDKVMDLIESFNKLSAAEEAQKAAEESMSKAYGDGMAKITQYKVKLDSFNGSKKEEKKLVEELNKEFGETLGTYKSIAEWQDVMKKKSDLYVQSLVKQAKAQAALNSVTAAYAKLMQVQMGIANGEYDGIWNKIFGKSGEARLVEAEREVEQMTKMLEDSQKELEQFNKDNKLGDYSPQIEKNTKKTENALEESQKTLNQLELRLMQDGLNKKLRQLDEEERQTINKLKENGRKTGVEIDKIQRAYAALRTKEIKEYLKNLEDSIRQSAQNIKNIQFDINIKDIEIEIDELKNKFDELSTDIPAYSTLTTRLDLNSVVSEGLSDDNIIKAIEFNDKMKDKSKEGIDKYYEFLEDYLKSKDDEFKEFFSDINDDSRYAILASNFEEEYKKELNIARVYGDEILNYNKENLKDATAALSASFSKRLLIQSFYYTNTIDKLVDNINKQSELNKKRIDEQYKQDYDAERERYRLQYNELEKKKELLDEDIKKTEAKNDKEVKLLEQLKEKRAQIEKQMEDALRQHGEKQGQLTEAKNNAIKKLELDTYKEISDAQEKYFDIQLSNYRDFQSKLNDEISKNPVTYGDWGIVNISETKKNYKEIIDASKSTVEALRDDKSFLERLYSQGLISPDAYNTTKRQLEELEKEIKNSTAVTAEASKNLISDFVSSIQQYLNAAMDSFQTIMGAVWDAQDIAFDKEQEQLDKENELLDKALDRQQEIVEQHKDAIDSIEDELSTARGSRRQHLIDQLNAEMELQRAAAAEEKRIQKEKEANEKKQDELEKKRKKAQYHRDLLQAVVNGALAVTYASMNTYPIPAIPLMALAASTTAAQVAIMAANKPYAKGGLLEGKSHAQGGIKVPGIGNGIELEGKEYVIRKKSTAPNMDVLDYINRSERKLDLGDFIDFYSSGKVKKSISSMSPRLKFADGGVIPSLRTDIDINDRLMTAFEDYSDRPVVVSVQDINSRQAAVRNVQVLAGLNPE